jgi:hypothetical protein
VPEAAFGAFAKPYYNPGGLSRPEMRALFFIRHPGYVRNFESALRELGTRGHTVQVALDSPKASWLTVNPLDVLVETTPGLTSVASPSFSKTRLVLADRALRISLDYLRYFDAEYRDAPLLRSRASRRVPRIVRSFPGLRFRVVRRPIEAALRLLGRTLPPVRAVDEFIAEFEPDVVLVTPLVALGSQQVEYVRAARRLAIPSVQCVTSWDHLTTKGLIHEVPDAVLVWNEAQRAEAVQLHGVPAERIVVTGAPCYDHWFGRRPSTTRDEFCARVGLRADRPIVLYLCSSPFIAPDEVSFVRSWLAALRGGGSPLADAGVLVRPHPQNSRQWDGVDLADDQVAVWPQGGDDPVHEAAKSSYFDSMYHAAAVVGVNTSGQIESAIVGRPVHTVLAPAFRGTQGGTLHFAHIAGDGGMLRVARSMEEHLAALADSLNGSGAGERERAFVERFIRPRGLDRAAAKEFADAVERIADGTMASEPSGRAGTSRATEQRQREAVRA